MSRHVYIIAEAGVNHNGSQEQALKLVDAAAESGADAVKFQTFKASSIASASAHKADYQKQTTDAAESQIDMLRRLELDREAHDVLLSHCREKNIEFLSTPFDLDSVELLTELGVSRMKIPSGEITNAPLLLKIARTGLPMIMSTGMADLQEVEEALGVLAFGLLDGDEPGSGSFRAAFNSRAGQAFLKKRVTLLHCTTEYPTPLEDVNLRAMDTLAEMFGLPAGYSDHTAGIVVPVAAAARGAVLVEKHFTLDRNLPGPDHKASLEPDELAEMVRSIRQVETALGRSEKRTAPSEADNKAVARKSLVAADFIRTGEVFSKANLTVKRPGTGISPMKYWEYLGRAAERDYQPDEVIES